MQKFVRTSTQSRPSSGAGGDDRSSDIDQPTIKPPRRKRPGNNKMVDSQVIVAGSRDKDKSEIILGDFPSDVATIPAVHNGRAHSAISSNFIELEVNSEPAQNDRGITLVINPNESQSVYETLDHHKRDTATTQRAPLPREFPREKTKNGNCATGHGQSNGTIATIAAAQEPGQHHYENLDAVRVQRERERRDRLTQQISFKEIKQALRKEFNAQIFVLLFVIVLLIIWASVFFPLMWDLKFRKKE